MSRCSVLLCERSSKRLSSRDSIASIELLDGVELAVHHHVEDAVQRAALAQQVRVVVPVPDHLVDIEHRVRGILLVPDCDHPAGSTKIDSREVSNRDSIEPGNLGPSAVA